MTNSKQMPLKVIVLLIHPLWQCAFCVLPLGLLVIISFWNIQNYQLTPAFTIDNYKTIIESSTYGKAFLSSLWLAVSTASLAVILAFPLAYIIVFHVYERWRRLIVFLLLLPFLSNYVIRMFSWQIWLNDQGILAFVLHWSRVYRGGLSLIYSGIATRIGLLSILIPIGSLVFYISFVRIDRALILAAQNLGASGWQAFWLVTLPLSLPGLAIAYLISFIISFGDFVSVSVLGGNQVYTVSTLLADRVKINDWPSAAALGTLMLLISIVVISVIFSTLRFLPSAGYRKRQ